MSVDVQCIWETGARCTGAPTLTENKKTGGKGEQNGSTRLTEPGCWGGSQVQGPDQGRARLWGISIETLANVMFNFEQLFYVQILFICLKTNNI